jgi:hypothetical protein
VLASDVLREDLVPLEPGARELRVISGVAGAILVALAAFSMRDPSQALAFAIPGLTAACVALLPVSYGTRALLAFAPACTALLMQSLTFPGTHVAAGLAFVLTGAGLPAALFYRSFFRASRRARGFVAAALLVAIVWLQLPGGGALFDEGSGAWAVAHAPAIALIGISLLSLLAFMGADTTAGCRAWATLAIAWAGFVAFAHHAAHGVTPSGWGAWSSAAATTALSAISALSGAALLALYARPTEPRTGIGAAASQH